MVKWYLWAHIKHLLQAKFLGPVQDFVSQVAYWLPERKLMQQGGLRSPASYC